MMMRSEKRKLWMLAATGAFCLAASTPSFAQEAGCGEGLVKRGAFAGDAVCVTVEARNAAAEQNENGGRTQSGADKCLPGFVWRMAGPQDHVCVSQLERDMAQHDNVIDGSTRSRQAGPPLPELEIPGARANVRVPPARPGCYRYERGDWRETPCMTDEFRERNFPPPTPQYSIKSYPNVFVTPRWFFTIPIVLASVDLSHLLDPAKGTVTDTTYGKDAFSIQVNSNFFTARNGNNAWVQFVLQSKAGVSVDALCVWNFDLTVFFADPSGKSGYTSTCVPIPKERTTFTAAHPEGRKTTFIGPGAQLLERTQVAGYLSEPPGEAPGLVAWAYVPWSSHAYSVSTKDTSGLAGKWFEVSGDIMGYAKGSRADFTDAEVRTVIKASACVDGGAYHACSQNISAPFSFSTSTAASVTSVTAETSNLKSNYGYAGMHTPAFSCLKESCWLDFSTGLFSFTLLNHP